VSPVTFVHELRIYEVSVIFYFILFLTVTFLYIVAPKIPANAGPTIKPRFEDIATSKYIL
jgi:hypothetical protein